jgi:hypothetical protein
MDPMKSKRAQTVLKAGQKTFTVAYHNEKRLKLGFWVGVDRQALFTADERFRIPKYTGHIGWIELDVHDSCDWDEIRNLALESYRHFANKRMLAALDVSASKRKS